MTKLFQKLNYKIGSAILCLNPPKSFFIELNLISEFAEIHSEPILGLKFRFAMAFISNKEELEKAIFQFFNFLEDDALLWFCYPKMSSRKFSSKINRDNGWEILSDMGFQTVRAVQLMKINTRFLEEQILSLNVKLVPLQFGFNVIPYESNSYFC